jgi:DNA-binding response OmpR family regulator
MRKPIILVVEDSDTMWYIYNDLLGDDYELRRAKDGREALHELVRAQPGLIVLDWTLDDIKPWDEESHAPASSALTPHADGDKTVSGLHVLRVIKRTALKTIPVIMLTGHTGLHEKLLGKLLRADKYLTKPLNEAVFVKTVHDLLPPTTALVERLKALQPPPPPLIKEEKSQPVAPAATTATPAESPQPAKALLRRPHVAPVVQIPNERVQLETAVSSQPDNLELRHQLYQYYLRVGMLKEANEQVRIAQKLLPQQRARQARGA